VIAGRSAARIPVSETTATSDCKARRFRRRNDSRFGLPISSSPSNRHRTLTEEVPTGWRYAPIAVTWVKSCPLSSDAPRPNRSEQ
jgi:hypothetical protein